jgi:O-antigen ligase
MAARTIALSGLFLWLFAAVLVLPGTEQYNALGLLVMVAAMLVIFLVARLAKSEWKIKWSLGDMPLGGATWFWLLCVMVTTEFSVNQMRSLNMVSLDATYGAIFILIFMLTTAGWTTHPMLLSALRFGALWYVFALGVLGINFYLTGGAGPWRPPSANMIAGMMNLLLLPTLAEFVILQLWRRAIWIGIALATIIVCASRGGWLGLSAGLVVLIIRERAALAPLAAKARRFLPVALPVGAVVAVAGLWQLNLPDRPLTSHMEFWSLAWNVFLAHPIAGSGPGTFQLWWVAAHPEAIPYTHALSLVLNTAAEQGIIGLTALAVLAVCTLRAAWPHPGLFAALVAFGFQNLVDGTHPEPAIMVTLAVLIGSTLAQGKQGA